MSAFPIDNDGPLWPTHAYQGQDRFVLEALNGLRDGFFLDSGAANGVRGSNTLLLERDIAPASASTAASTTATARWNSSKAAACSAACCKPTAPAIWRSRGR